MYENKYCSFSKISRHNQFLFGSIIFQLMSQMSPLIKQYNMTTEILFTAYILNLPSTIICRFTFQLSQFLDGNFRKNPG